MRMTDAPRFQMHDGDMKHADKQDLSSAYGDRDDMLSWPALILVISYSLTIGWIRLLARGISLHMKSRAYTTGYRHIGWARG
jgi:hypothetical protein